MELRPIGQRSMNSGTVRKRSAVAVFVVMAGTVQGCRPRGNRRTLGTPWDAPGPQKLWKKLWQRWRRRRALTEMASPTREIVEHPQRDSNPCRHLERVVS